MKTKLTLISAILAILLVMTAGFWIKRSNALAMPPSYQFLADRELKMAFDDDKWSASDNAIRYIYSFQGDSNDILSIVSTELNALGFRDNASPGSDYIWSHSFHLTTSPSKSSTEVRIHKRQMLNPRSTPDLVMYRIRDEWVSIEIIQAVSKPRWQLYVNQFLGQ